MDYPLGITPSPAKAKKGKEVEFLINKNKAQVIDRISYLTRKSGAIGNESLLFDLDIPDGQVLEKHDHRVIAF
jgi:hypothetical protein